MAMNKYGRFSPKTTDPKTGARIADPEVYGQTLPNNSKVSSWPEVRTMFQSGKLNEQFFGKGGTKNKPTGGSYSSYPSDVKNYLEGKTDKLDDINYEEPVISEDYAETGSSRKITYANLNYKVNSPKWNESIKKGTPKGYKYTPSEEGVNQQVDIGSTGGWGETYGTSTIRERKSKPETKTPEPTQKTTLEPIPKLNERKPKPMKYLKDKNAVSEGDWESPVPSRYGVSIDKSREGGQRGGFGLRNKIVGSNGDKKLTSSLGIDITKGGGRREEKMAKSFYAPTSELNHGSYYSNMSETTQDDLSKSIRSQIKDIKSERKDWKSKTSLTGSDKREGMSMYKQDIKTARLAAKYAKKGDLYSIGGNEWAAGSGSRLRTWTPDQDKRGNEGAMSGYVKSAKQNIERIGQLKQAEQRNITNANIAESNRSSSKRESYIKAADDNATNRNSTQSRMNEFWGWNNFGK